MKLDKVKRFLNNIQKDHVSEYTAQCAYYTILAFIPFIILLMSLVQYINIDKETLLNIVGNIIPTSMNDRVISIIQEVYSKSIGTISVSAIFVFWSAGNGFFALNKGLHAVYEIPNEKNYFYLRFKSIIFTIIFIILIVVTLISLVFGNSIIHVVNENFEAAKGITAKIRDIRTIGSFVSLFIVFLIIYKFIPGHKSKFKSQIPGAIFASVGWWIISYIFSIYVDVFKGFSAMYGSLTTIVLVMMWVYACMYIVLIGAEINKTMINRRFLSSGKKNIK